jgi:hypothetical protein
VEKKRFRRMWSKEVRGGDKERREEGKKRRGDGKCGRGETGKSK